MKKLILSKWLARLAAVWLALAALPLAASSFTIGTDNKGVSPKS